MTILSTADAVTLYRHSVVQYEDQLYWISEIQETNERQHNNLLGFNMKTGKPASIPADPDEVLAPTLTRLGYVNLEKLYHAQFLSRMPCRQYKVGWGEGNVRNWNSHFSNKWKSQFMDMVENNYPSCRELIEEPRELMTAFDRQWAIYGGDLYFCGKVVGVVRQGKLRLSNDKNYLASNLEKSGGLL